jgi:uncharacterized phage protein (TIGR01671 family)
MTREIKFRGKVKHHDPMTNPENGWAEGYYFQDLTQGEMRSFIFQPPCNWEVIPETVGQFTGLLDKNGKEIFEGDIIRTKRYGVVHGQSNTQGADLFRVVYKNAQFYIDNKLRHFYLQDSKCNEVIGNVFDNPELLKTETL